MAVIGKIIAMTGVANIINEKGESRTVVPGEQLQTGDTLQTPPGVTVKVQLENGRVIDVAAGQMISFTEELTNVIVPEETDNAVDLATIDTVIDAIESGQDLDEVLEATAAGGAGGSEGGHSAVFLDRINLFLNPLAQSAANEAATDISVNPTNGFLNPLLAEQFVDATPVVAAPITVVSVISGIDDPDNPGNTVGDEVIEGVETDPLLFQVGLSAVPVGGEEVTLTFADVTAEFGVDTASTISIDFGDGNGFVDFPVVGGTVTVTVPAGAQNFVVSLATTEDTDVEDLEQLTLTASTTNNVGTLPSATGGIIDNDGVVFVQTVQAGTGTFDPSIPGGIDGSVVVEGDVNDPLLFEVGLNAATPLSGATVTLRFEDTPEGKFGIDTTTDILIDFGDGFVPVTVTPEQSNGVTTYEVDVPSNVQTFVVNVPTTDDAFLEDAENILFSAFTSSNGVDGNPAAPAQVTGTILDDDTPLLVEAVQAGTGTFDPSIPGGVDGSVVTEGDVDDPLLFEVELNRVAVDGDEVVTLSFTNGTADFGDDTTFDILIDFGDGNGFVPVTATPTPGGPGETTYDVTVPAGTKDFVVQVPTTDDNTEEDPETVLFTASTLNNDASNPAPAQVTGTILDDDTPVYVENIQAGIEPANQPGADLVGATVNEGEPLLFNVNLNTVATEDVIVALTFANDTADFGVDTSFDIELDFGDGGGFVLVAVSPTTVGGETVYNVTVPKGTKSFDVKVPTVVDNEPEGSQVIQFSAATAANQTIPFPIDPVPGTILDETFELPTVAGLNGEYYGYNNTNFSEDYRPDEQTINNTNPNNLRVHADDDLTMVSPASGTFGNVDSVADVEGIVNGRNGSNIVGTSTQSGDGVPDVRFFASSVMYGLSSNVNSEQNLTVENNLGNNVVQASGESLDANSALSTFLAGDAASAVVQDGSPTTATSGATSGTGVTTESIVRITGSVFLERGSYDFRVYADDGFRLRLGGETLIEFDGNQSPTEHVFENLLIENNQAGLTPIELLYWETGEQGVLHLEFKSSSEPESAFRTFSVDNLPMFPEVYPDLALADNQTIVNTGTTSNPVWEIQTGQNISGDGPITGSSNADILTGSVGNDTLEGLEGSDNLNGGEGSDTLIGGEGNDQLDGGSGADQMTGGLGDDRYVIDNVGDITIEQASEGVDTIDLAASYDPGTFTLEENFENVNVLGSQAVDITGNASDNRIQGGSGDDTIDGQAGDDRIIGGAGNDMLTGGAGKDVFEWNLSDKGTVADPTVDHITDFEFSGNGVTPNPYSFGEARTDAIDIRDLLQGEFSTVADANRPDLIDVGNLLDYLDIDVSGGNTTINISSSGNIAGGADQQIVLDNVDLFSAAGVTAGDQASLLQNLLANGSLIVD